MDIVLHFGREQFKVTQTQMTGLELRNLFKIPATDDLFRAKGTKVDGPAIQDGDLVALKNGDHFTSSPKNVSGGGGSVVALRPRVEREVALIRDEFAEDGEVELHPSSAGDAAAVIVVPARGEGWHPEPVRVLLKIPLAYPEQRPDLIFPQEGASGPAGVPRFMGTYIDEAHGRWAMVSWHYSRADYDPNEHHLVAFARSVRVYLSRTNP